MSDKTSLQGKRVFVSGGAGVIGLELVPRLVGRGASVFVGDLKPRPDCFDRAVHYRQGDLNYLTKGELESFSPEIFVHLAATFERSTESYGFWEENFWNNVRLSHHLMTIARNLQDLKRVIFASSYLIYEQKLYQFDSPQSRPAALKETDPISPRNLTGMAKLAHEIELAFLASFLQPRCTLAFARIFRGYGCGSRDVISRWVRALLSAEPIVVYRPEGMFDYVYAKDTAEGLVRLVEASTFTGAVNLGTGKARSVQEVLDILRQHFPVMNVIHGSSEIPFEASAANMEVFGAAVGWMPEYGLERAIPEIIAHERKELTTKRAARVASGHALITSASRKVPLVQAAQRAARKLNPEIKVLAGDLNKNALARHFADNFWQMPRTVDSEISILLDGCLQRGIRTIFPTRDSELLFWAQHQPSFAKAGIDVVVSSAASVQTCLDKLAFAQFGAKSGLPFIPAAAHPDQVGNGPYVVKERYGAGARRIGLDLPRESALQHGSMLEYPIYQPFVAGKEISVDAWLDRHCQVKGLVLRSRDQVVDGESQVTTTFRDAVIEELVTQALHALKLRGPVVMQLLLDAGRNVHIIECNSRFGGASTASIAAGLDIFYWSLLESHGADVSEYPFHRTPGEVRQVRAPNDIHIYGHHI